MTYPRECMYTHAWLDAVATQAIEYPRQSGHGPPFSLLQCAPAISDDCRCAVCDTWMPGGYVGTWADDDDPEAGIVCSSSCKAEAALIVSRNDEDDEDVWYREPPPKSWVIRRIGETVNPVGSFGGTVRT